MQGTRPSLFARHDTFFGVCEALGQDLRINANCFRVAFAIGLLLSPLWALGGYGVLGLAVAGSRWLFPARSAQALPAPAAARGLRSDNDAEAVTLADAA